MAVTTRVTPRVVPATRRDAALCISSITISAPMTWYACGLRMICASVVGLYILFLFNYIYFSAGYLYSGGRSSSRTSSRHVVYSTYKRFTVRPAGAVVALQRGPTLPRLRQRNIAVERRQLGATATLSMGPQPMRNLGHLTLQPSSRSLMGSRRT